MLAMVGRSHMNMAASSSLQSTSRLWIVLTGFDLVGRIFGWRWLNAWGFARLVCFGRSDPWDTTSGVNRRQALRCFAEWISECQ